MRSVSYVVEIRDKSGERGWGKLYEPVYDDGKEEDSELLEALTEATSYMDVGYVDEAVDISDNFGQTTYRAETTGTGENIFTHILLVYHLLCIYPATVLSLTHNPHPPSFFKAPFDIQTA